MINNSTFGSDSDTVLLGTFCIATTYMYFYLNLHVLCHEFMNTKFQTSNLAYLRQHVQFMPSHCVLLSLFYVTQVKS